MIYNTKQRKKQSNTIKGNGNPNWKGGRIQKTCARCGSPFLVFPSQLSQRFCSLVCANRDIAERNAGKQNPKRRKYGADNPAWKGGLSTYICVYCGKAFGAKPSAKRECCSRQCAAKLHHQREGSWFGGNPPDYNGDKNPNWKGGITPEKHLPRGLFRYRSWRKAVFERDNYTCQTCGSKENLNAHHIKPFKDFPELRFDVSNGLTLCVNCHKE